VRKILWLILPTFLFLSFLLLAITKIATSVTNVVEITLIPEDKEDNIPSGTNIIGVPTETTLDQIASICGDKTKIFKYYDSKTKLGCAYNKNGYFLYFNPVGNEKGDCDSNFFSEAKLRAGVGYYVDFQGKNGDGVTSCKLRYEDGVLVTGPISSSTTTTRGTTTTSPQSTTTTAGTSSTTTTVGPTTYKSTSSTTTTVLPTCTYTNCNGAITTTCKCGSITCYGSLSVPRYCCAETNACTASPEPCLTSCGYSTTTSIGASSTTTTIKQTTTTTISATTTTTVRD